MRVSDFVYFPRLGGYKFTTHSCAYLIKAHETRQGIMVRQHQCDKKPTNVIGEYKFCKQHANMVMREIQNDREANNSSGVV